MIGIQLRQTLACSKLCCFARSHCLFHPCQHLWCHKQVEPYLDTNTEKRQANVRLKASEGALCVWQESLAALKLLACGEAALCGVVASNIKDLQQWIHLTYLTYCRHRGKRWKKAVVEGLLFCITYIDILSLSITLIIFLCALNTLQTHYMKRFDSLQNMMIEI